MAKKLTVAQQAENAIKWIDRLTRYKKTTYVLRSVGDETKYCCLGVACKLLEEKPDYSEASYDALPALIGINGSLGGFSGLVDGYNNLARVNDAMYGMDPDFKNMKKFIKKNIKYIFKPSVAKLVAKHYAD